MWRSASPRHLRACCRPSTMDHVACAVCAGGLRRFATETASHPTSTCTTSLATGLRMRATELRLPQQRQRCKCAMWLCRSYRRQYAILLCHQQPGMPRGDCIWLRDWGVLSLMHGSTPPLAPCTATVAEAAAISTFATTFTATALAVATATVTFSTTAVADTSSTDVDTRRCEAERRATEQHIQLQIPSCACDRRRHTLLDGEPDANERLDICSGAGWHSHRARGRP